MSQIPEEDYLCVYEAGCWHAITRYDECICFLPCFDPKSPPSSPPLLPPHSRSQVSFPPSPSDYLSSFYIHVRLPVSCTSMYEVSPSPLSNTHRFFMLKKADQNRNLSAGCSYFRAWDLPSRHYFNLVLEHNNNDLQRGTIMQL